MNGVDSSAKRLLEIIAIRHAENKPMTVSDCMALNEIASRATIHRKLNVLLEAGWISLEHKGDRRTKYLIATELADRYFSMIGDALRKSV